MITSVLILSVVQDYFLNNINYLDWKYRGIAKNKEYGRFIKKVAKIVAKHKKIPTIFVEYAGLEHELETKQEIEACLGTHPLILKENKKAIRITKKINDGSKVIVNCCKKYNLPQDFIVCGVNADACVLETVTQLVNKYKKEVSVIDEGTRNVYDKQRYKGVGHII